ncbi:MAG: AsmA family protein [Deltaproteobacteria bacterium]|nr:AsmA family protein [Deltaproteobacteria bacterium]
MPKIYKWLAAIVGSLLLLFLLLVLFVRFYLTGGLIAAWIEPPMENYLHRDVTIADARIGFRGFRVDGLEIHQRGSNVPLLKGETLELRWKFKELLKGNIVIHTLVFTKPEIALIRDEDGKLNIADLLPKPSDSTAAGNSSTDAGKERAGLPLLISLLSMEDGHLSFVDRSHKPQATLEIRNLNSRINDLSVSTPIPFQIEGQIVGMGKGTVVVNGTYNPASENLQGNVSLKEVDLARITPFIAGEHSNDIQEGNLTLETSLSAEKFDNFVAQGSLNLDKLRIKGGEKLSEPLLVEAAFQLDALLSKETLKVNSLNLALNGQMAEIQGTLTKWQQKPFLDFTLTSPEIKLDELLALLPKAQPTPKTTEVVTDQPASVEDKPTIPKGDQPASVEDNSSTPTVAEEASSEVVSSPSSSESEEQLAEQTPETSPQSTQAFNLDAQGVIHLDWFHYNKLVASNVDCKVNFQEGKMRVQPLTASLYGGTLGGNIKTDPKTDGPTFNAAVYTENILLDEIVRAIWPETGGHWSGNVNLFFKGNGSGSDLSALDSRIDLNINEADFSEHPLITKLAELFQAENLKQLRFSQVTARVLTKEGTATIKRLHLMGPIVQAEGSGTAGLLDKNLNLHLLLQIRAQYVGKIAPLRDIVTKISDKHGFVQLPLTVQGTFDEPVYGLDKSWLEKTAKRVGIEQVKKVRKKQPPKQPLNEQKQKELKEGLEKLVQ